MKNAEQDAYRLERSWVRIGGIAGVSMVPGYLAILFAPLPRPLARLIFFAIPLAGIIFVLGLYRLMSVRRNGETAFSLQLAMVFGVIRFSILNLMAVVQNSIHIWISEGLPTAEDPASREMVRWVQRSVNSVQLGMDVSFDIFILISVILFGTAMLSHPLFGPLFGVSGCVAALATLSLNLYTFPVPPDMDLGPAVAIWLGAVEFRML